MKKCCLIVIDGWGMSCGKKGDAIQGAKTPEMTRLSQAKASTSLAAHGLAVGLPDGLMGNSEVGHLNIGSGRIVYQDIVRIDLSVSQHNLHLQTGLSDAFARARETGRLHLCGLVSDGGVHAHQRHLYELLAQAKAAAIPHTFIHFFADGRDTSPKSAAGYLTQLHSVIDELDYASVATITGRYYAMDRDKRWERIKIAYDALVDGKGVDTVDYRRVFRGSCRHDTRQDKDTVVCFNYRSDRMREIAQAMGVPPLPFEGSRQLQDVSITTMTRYKADFPFPLIFPAQTMKNVLAEWCVACIFDSQDRQKGHQTVPHRRDGKNCSYTAIVTLIDVTFFFNGGTEQQYTLEDRDLIDSPKVATYDLKPEMSAIPVAERVAERVRKGDHPLVLCNFAPPDMVGHTGKYDAAVLAIEATDTAIGIISKACLDTDTVLLVTADHGNAEQMLAEDGVTPHTAHTCSRVPFYMQGADGSFEDGGKLCDVAPTLLDIMGLDVPPEMDGKSLWKK